MSLIDVLIAPGAAVGCVVGIGVAAMLHWFFPERDLLYLQATLVVVGVVACHVITHWGIDRPPRS